VLALGDMRVGKGTADFARDAAASSAGLRETTLSRGLLLVSMSLMGLMGLVSTDEALRVPIGRLAMAARALISFCLDKLSYSKRL